MEQHRGSKPRAIGGVGDAHRLRRRRLHRGHIMGPAADRSIPGTRAGAMRRIQVTNKEGNAIYLNTDHIVWVRPVRGDAEGPAKIMVVAGEAIDAQETAGEILRRIDAADG